MPLGKIIRLSGKDVELKSASAAVCNFPQELNKSKRRTSGIVRGDTKIKWREARLMLHELFGGQLSAYQICTCVALFLNAVANAVA